MQVKDLQMKRALLSVLIVLLLSVVEVTKVQAQELTIYDGTVTNAYVPVYGYYADAYLKCEMVYPAETLYSMAGNAICNMRFYASQTNVNWGVAYFQVFMKEVEDASISDFNGTDGATIVYVGSLGISDGVMDVVFSTPYQYNGGNLLVGFYNTFAGGSYVNCNWYGETVEGASVQGYSFNGLSSITPSQRNFLPKTTFHWLGEGTITVVADPEEGGTVTGGGLFDGGQTCTVNAVANDGYSFAYWMNNGAIVSTSSTYTFLVAGDMTLVAHFVTENIIVFADANVRALCVANWDTDGDGELSYEEAAAVTSLGEVFRSNTEISSFEELQYFVGLTSINDYAFYECSNLEGSLKIPYSVTTIGNYAFCNCSSFTGDLVIPNSVTTIGDVAFYYCSGFTGGLTIPNTVTTIGDSAFNGCSGFTGSLTIPNSVTSIGEVAFGGCIGLTGNLTISSSITYLTGFAGCNFSGELVIPNSITTIGVGAFKNCTGFTGELVIPNSVTTIGSSAFYNCDCFTGELVIPNSVTTIDPYAFYDCDGFTGSLIIPNSVTTIGVRAFQGCSGFNGDLTIGNSVTEIVGQSFNSCTGFTGNLTIGNSVTTIEDAFRNCSGFTGDLVIPNSVTTIGYAAFEGCSGFTGNLIIPNSVTSIGLTAFSGCSGFTGDLVIPNSVTEIDRYAFSGCSAFNGSLTISNSVTSIREYTFYNCSGFTGNLTIPNSVTTISNDAFRCCRGFTGDLTIPNSVTSISFSAFLECSGFTGNLVIPNSVTEICDNAFCECSGFTGSLIIPTSVTVIGNSAFRDCSGLTEVIMLGTNPPTLGNSNFNNLNYPYAYYPIYVPYESLNAYQTASNWSNFWSNYPCRMYPMSYTAIPGYGEEEGNWRFIASPLVENIVPTTVNNMITETPYDLYQFNQSAEDGEWQNYKANNFDLTNGQGYLYANAEDKYLVFKGEFNEEDTKAVDLSYDANAGYAGWNLVGNPFPVSAYANRSYYVMNEEGTAIEPVAVSMETAIPACTGVMVKADNVGEMVTFSKTAPRGKENQGVLQIAAAQADTRSAAMLDKAIVSFNASDRLEKFVFNKDNVQLFIPRGKDNYAIVSAEKTGEMPLNFKAKKNGFYTITVDAEMVDMDYLHLIDNLTGNDVDLLAEPTYIFEAKTTDYASRFKLVFSVSEDANGGDDSFAFFNGNAWTIANEGSATLQVVDILGHVISSETINGNVTFSTGGFSAGVYMMRLMNGEKVEVQKVVVR